MRLANLDLNLFFVFEAIYNQRNLTRAAEVLCITQPAVSNALARLRRALDDPLFISTPGGMMPTPMSENMIGRVREALQLLESSVHESDRFNPAASERVFHLSMADLPEALLLPAIGARLQAEAPAMHVRSYYTERSEVPRALANGTLDIAIDAPVIDDPHLCRAFLGKDRYVCMIRDDHPFTKSAMSLDDYLALGHVHVSSRRKGSGYVDTELSRIGQRRTIQMRVQHYMVAPLIALRTDLALTAPSRLLQRYPGRIYELPFEVPEQAWYCYWHAGADKDPGNLWMRALLSSLMEAGEGGW